MESRLREKREAVNIGLLLVVFVAPVVAGCVMGAVSWWRPRLHLARAFARGLTDTIARLPAPMEPLPDLTRKAAA